MDNTLSRQILLAVLGLALLVLAIVGVSYAITIPNKSLNKVYLVSDDNSAISLNNLPMSDYEGINLMVVLMFLTFVLKEILLIMLVLIM